MSLTNLIMLTADTTTGTESTGAFVMSFLPMILILVIFYFILLRPQKKKEKETQSMRENIEIGDEILTIGGIIGIVVRQTDDTIVIETGGERTKIRIKKWAIQENLTQHEQVQTEVVEKKKEKKEKKSDKDIVE